MKCVSVSGEPENFQCTYDDASKTVSFDTTHLSAYAVVYTEPASSSGGVSMVLIILIVVVIVVILFLVLWMLGFLESIGLRKDMLPFQIGGSKASPAPVEAAVDTQSTEAPSEVVDGSEDDSKRSE